MRILLLCNKSPWPPKDGGAAATLNMIQGLSVGNVSVTVLSLNSSKHFVNMEEIPGELSKSIDYHLINFNSKINPFSLLLNLVLSLKPYNLERFWSPKYNSELKKVIRNGFDIIQLEGLSMYHYLPVIRQTTSTPVVFRSHNVEYLIWERLMGEEKNFLKRLYFKILARRIKKLEIKIINKCDALLSISNPDLEWFKAEGLTVPAIITQPGFNPEEIKECHEPAPNKICFIGALDWLPNINGLNWFVKEVWPVVVNRIPEAEFFVAGRNASQKTIAELMGHNITFAGEVESSSQFLIDKALMVVPLFSGSGIRMKIIEGMIHGKCIVATPVAAEGIDYEDKMDIFIASDAGVFASDIIELLTNHSLRIETGKNAIKNVRKNYNIFVSSENLMNFYRGLTT